VSQETIIPSDANTFQCVDCGFSVDRKGQRCAICQDKADARGPQGSELLRPMGVQPTLRDGGKQVDPDAEDEDGDEVEE
jgi:hypothetical protein